MTPFRRPLAIALLLLSAPFAANAGVIGLIKSILVWISAYTAYL